MLPLSVPCCRLIALGELTRCLQWALPRYRIDRASWILSQVTQRVQAGRSSEIIAGTASQPCQACPHEQLLAAAIAIPHVAGAATLLLLQAVSPEELRGFTHCDRPLVAAEAGIHAATGAESIAAGGKELIRSLLEPMLQRLRSLGITFLQAACDEPHQAVLLQAAGFEPLADLSLMELPAAGFASAVKVAAEQADQADFDSGALQWIDLAALGEDWMRVFADVAADTFANTYDCPRLGDYRTADEIVAAYLAAPAMDRELSKLLRVEDQWAGCLVLTRHEAPVAMDEPASNSHSPVALALTYMGLKPQYRRKRLASQLLAETVRVAQQLEASQVLLAVDQKNEPARSIYQRFGWRDVAQESVWGRRV